jgi:hypothetical protein
MEDIDAAHIARGSIRVSIQRAMLGYHHASYRVPVKILFQSVL